VATCIALLRGVNVGKAKRIAMADLRSVIESLGHTRVRTVLNSGNVVFDASRANAGKLSQAIDAAIEKQFGFTARVSVITAQELDAIIGKNPLSRAAKEPARFLIAIAATDAAMAKAKPLAAQRWAPEALAIEGRVAYLYCANGLIESKVWKAIERATDGGATARNWATMLKLQAVADAKDE